MLLHALDLLLACLQIVSMLKIALDLLKTWCK